MNDNMLKKTLNDVLKIAQAKYIWNMLKYCECTLVLFKGALNKSSPVWRGMQSFLSGHYYNDRMSIVIFTLRMSWYQVCQPYGIQIVIVQGIREQDKNHTIVVLPSTSITKQVKLRNTIFFSLCYLLFQSLCYLTWALLTFTLRPEITPCGHTIKFCYSKVVVGQSSRIIKGACLPIQS